MSWSWLRSVAFELFVCARFIINASRTNGLDCLNAIQFSAVSEIELLAKIANGLPAVFTKSSVLDGAEYWKALELKGTLVRSSLRRY